MEYFIPKLEYFITLLIIYDYARNKVASYRKKNRAYSYHSRDETRNISKLT